MKIRRKGETADRWSDDFTTGGKIWAKPGVILIRVTLPAKGSKRTNVLIRLEQIDYAALKKAELDAGFKDDAAILRAKAEFLNARADALEAKAAKPPVVGFQLPSAARQSEAVSA